MFLTNKMNLKAILIMSEIRKEWDFYMEVTLSNKKKMLRTIFCSFLVMLILILRIAFIQFHDGNKLQLLAYEQLVQQRAISAKRGSIYDSTGKYILAVSSTAYQITINPTNITKDNKEKVARALSDICELDYEKTLVFQ